MSHQNVQQKLAKTLKAARLLIYGICTVSLFYALATVGSAYRACELTGFAEERYLAALTGAKVLAISAVFFNGLLIAWVSRSRLFR